MSAPDGGSAFPGVRIENHGGTIQEDSAPGMTLRDYFAAKALVALVPSNAGTVYLAGFAHGAYAIADAMLKVRAAQ